MKVNALFLLESRTYNELVSLFCSELGANSYHAIPFQEMEKNGVKTLITSDAYLGNAALHRRIVARLIKGLPTVISDNWEAPSTVALYIYYKELNAYGIAIQSISEPNEFCTMIVGPDGKVNDEEDGFLKRYPNPYYHYVVNANREYKLAIVCDVYGDPGYSPIKHLLDQATEPAEEVIVINPDRMIGFCKQIAELRDSLITSDYALV